SLTTGPAGSAARRWVHSGMAGAPRQRVADRRAPAVGGVCCRGTTPSSTPLTRRGGGRFRKRAGARNDNQEGRFASCLSFRASPGRRGYWPAASFCTSSAVIFEVGLSSLALTQLITDGV